MGELLGQQVVVENVGGAGGMTGSKRVADAKPDGYTMVLGSVGTHAQNQTLYKRPLYNVETDFTPVAYLAITPIALITRPDLPVNNLKEFVAYAKANQSKMQFGSAGAGSATHLGCVVLNTAMGTPMITHVPYKGTGPAMQDLIGGRIDYLCEIIATAKPQIEGQKVKGIAIMTKERSPVLPNLADHRRTGPRRPGLYLERAVPAERRAGRCREEAQRSRGRRNCNAGGAGAPCKTRRDRCRTERAQPAMAGRLREERSQKVGSPDQGKRRAGGIRPAAKVHAAA